MWCARLSQRSLLSGLKLFLMCKHLIQMFQLIPVQTSQRDSGHVIHLFHFQQVICFGLVSGHLLWYDLPTQYHNLQEVLNKARLCLARPTISSSTGTADILFLLITYTHCQKQSTTDNTFHFCSVSVMCLLSCCNHVVFDLKLMHTWVLQVSPSYWYCWRILERTE